LDLGGGASLKFIAFYQELFHTIAFPEEIPSVQCSPTVIRAVVAFHIFFASRLYVFNKINKKLPEALPKLDLDVYLNKFDWSFLLSGAPFVTAIVITPYISRNQINSL
jgi:hypothetical protein